MKKKRSQLDIIHDILAVIQARGGRIRPTHLLTKSNLSSDMMREYLPLLVGRGLVFVEEDGSHKEYAITDKGRQYLFEYEKMASFTEAFGL